MPTCGNGQRHQRRERQRAMAVEEVLPCLSRQLVAAADLLRPGNWLAVAAEHALDAVAVAWREQLRSPPPAAL